MTPQPGQSIVIIFRNGMQIEGDVISWSDQISVLKSYTGTSKIVINKTIEDVMFYKLHSAKAELEKIKQRPIKENDIKTLAELKNDLYEVEKAEVREKLSDHKANSLQEVQYGIPGNIKIKSSKQHTLQESPRANPAFGSQLQNLFNKKH